MNTSFGNLALSAISTQSYSPARTAYVGRGGRAMEDRKYELVETTQYKDIVVRIFSPVLTEEEAQLEKEQCIEQLVRIFSDE